MLNQEEINVQQNRFAAWLAKPDGGAFVYELGGWNYTVIRVRKSEHFDYLYCQRRYSETTVERGKKFDYAGVYCKKDGLVYDSQYEIKDLADVKIRSADVLLEMLQDAVRRSVEDVVANDRGNLTVTEISNERERNELEYFQKYVAHESARKAYLNGEFEDSGHYAYTFQCGYKPANWTEDSLLAYILDPAQYAAAEAEVYSRSHQEKILADFLRSDFVAEQYAKILANPHHPIHRVRKIMRALNASPAKIVHVTVRIGGQELTFKAEADQFRRDCTSTYYDRRTVAADRREFQQRFGRNAEYGPEHIIRIEYARSVLYEAEGEQA